MTESPEQAVRAGVNTACELNDAVRCARGLHAWVPWLALPPPTLGDPTRYVTWCCRPGCDAQEQYDL